jgi:nucleotide-binding universal stress UspA family protein
VQNNKQMISKILVAVDDSEYAEKAFEYASYLAKKCGSGLLIVHVLEEFVSVGHSILKELEQRDLEMLQKYKSRAKESSAITSIDVTESRGDKRSISNGWSIRRADKYTSGFSCNK